MLVHVTASFRILRVRVTSFPANVFRTVTLVLYIYIHISTATTRTNPISSSCFASVFFPVGSFHLFLTVETKFGIPKNFLPKIKPCSKPSKKKKQAETAPGLQQQIHPQLVADFWQEWEIMRIFVQLVLALNYIHSRKVGGDERVVFCVVFGS